MSLLIFLFLESIFTIFITMNKPAYLGFFIAFGLTMVSIFLYRFFLKSDEQIIIDNPTAANLEVYLNDKKFVLSSWQSVPVDIEKGIFSLKVVSPDSLRKDTIIQIFSSKALINPTLSDYYVYHQFYGQKKEKDSILNNVESTIDGTSYIGNVKKFSSLYIDEFYFNKNEEFPSFARVDSFLALGKIFRKSEFGRFYKTYYK